MLMAVHSALFGMHGGPCQMETPSTDIMNTGKYFRSAPACRVIMEQDD